MNIRDLNYLIAIADLQHFGKAADACFVSQPALSMQIKKLEETLGVSLIERTNKRLYFTEVGHLIVNQAREIIHRVKNLQDIANQSKDPFGGELHLGIIPTLAPYLLPIIIPKLSSLFPKLKIFLVEETTQHLLNKLNQGKLDCALISVPVTGDFVFHRLFEEEFVLAVDQKHCLAKNKRVNLDDLDNKTLMLLEDGHCLRDHALAVCHKARATEIQDFRATSLETLRHMVAAGVGITLMPKSACRLNDGVCYIPFNNPVPKVTLGLIWRESTTKTILLEEMVKQIKIMKSGV